MLNILWIIVSAVLVLLMQAGFTCLETGLVRNKNSINVAIKNLMDLCVSGAVFWLIGFGLMFGDSYNGWLGHDLFLFAGDQGAFLNAFFIFQIMFCGTAITIVSGAVAERMSFTAYMLSAVLMAGFIYPVTGHWAWAGVQDGHLQGWLGIRGFIDFAGSTVVHSVGGWCALSAVLILGPRLGRFSVEGGIPGSSLPLSVLGTLFLWIGWFGFNGGSVLAMNETVTKILLNTFLAAVFGGLSAASCSQINSHHINVIDCINGVLGGLVAITASCHVMTPSSAILIAMIAGICTFFGSKLLEHYKIDDAVGAIPVHLFAGIWGTLAIPFFSDPSAWGTDLSRWQQFEAQLTGVLSIGLYAFIVSYCLFKAVDRFYSLRVSVLAEQEGLNIAEHMAPTEIYNLLNAMLQQEKRGDFKQQVEIEPFTEVGLIARQYNNVLKRVNQEISVREQALNAYQQSESRKGAILNSALDSIMTITTDGVIREFNLAAEKCFGLSFQRVANRNFVDLFVPPSLRSEFRKSLKSNFSTDSQWVLDRHNKTTLLRIHDIEFPAELSITQVQTKNGGFKEFTFHIRDITRQLEMQNKIHHLAFHDSLTGLYNRAYFVAKLNQEIEFANRHRNTILLMFLDLDQFKAINDSLGHDVGDQVLRRIAGQLRCVVREEDLICRWGGDEFIIMFPGIAERNLITDKAGKIIDLVGTPFHVSDKQIYVHTSIGIALSKNGEILAEQLIQQADMAMYEAKQQGKNSYCFFQPEMQEALNKYFDYKVELRNAVKQNQFFLEYQPKVDCQHGGVIGFEALLRWSHPEKGIVSPGEFIPVLEESGMINDVTSWLLESVCRQLNIWRAKGLFVVPVAINLSAKDFLVSDFYEQVVKFLQIYNIPGHLLELEITETILATNTEQCIDLMSQLRKLNISFSIDDFGTGYSSMSYLKKFPLDTLKIDRAFVHECDVDKEDAAICQAIIALGKSLGLNIIAEGVETQAQLEFLQKTGCAAYQGFLFSRSIPPSEVNCLLAENFIPVE